jgi:hypothetical protein
VPSYHALSPGTQMTTFPRASSSVSVFEIADCPRRLAQRVRPVDDRREGAGLDELLQEPCRSSLFGFTVR